MLGLITHFDLKVELLPPAVVLSGLQVEASDGSPAVAAERVRMTPLFFSLLSGRFNAGDIELIRPRVRLAVGGGKLLNLSLHLPESSDSSSNSISDPRDIPLRSITIEDAHIHLSLEDQGLKLQLRELDLDVTSSGEAMDLSVQLAESSVQLRRLVDGQAVFDDDALCNLQLRAHYDDGGVLVRRFELDARTDHDPASGMPPSCQGEVAPESHLSLQLSRLRVRESPATPFPIAAGRVHVEGPLRLLPRYVPDAPAFSGDVGLLADVSFSGRPELPEVKGQLLAKDVLIDGIRTVVRTLDAQVEAGGGEIRIPEGKATYGDGDVSIKNAKVQIFERGIPIFVEEVALKNIQFPGLMRDIGITRHTIVNWTLEQGAFQQFKGLALDPDKGGPSLMGDLWVDTADFELGDRGWDDPRRQRVIGVKKAKVRGRFGVERYGILFRQMSADFGQSHLEVPAVTIGFDDILEARAAKGTRINLAEISPISGLQVTGRMEVEGGVCCKQSDPTVEGDLRVTGFQMAGLPLADTVSAHAKFKPFILELSKVIAHKSHEISTPQGVSRSVGSQYTSERIRVDFDRPRGILVEGNIDTKQIDFRDMLDLFLLEKDPRFSQIFGTGSARAHLRFDVGGPDDVCGSGVMTVQAQASLGTMSLYGERYDGGEAELDFKWFDREALERGMNVELRSVTLQKGQGIISGAGAMRGGAVITGYFTAQNIPMTRIDAMGDLGRAMDGNISAMGSIRGTADAPEVEADIRFSPVRIGQKILPASSLKVNLVPAEQPSSTAPVRKTSRCKEIIPNSFDPKVYAKDISGGIFHTSGELFGGQITLNDVQTTWQQSKQLSGEILADNLDLGAFLQLSPSFALSDRPPLGRLTGRFVIEHAELDHLERTSAYFSVRDFNLRRGASILTLEVPKGSTSVEGTIKEDTLALGDMIFGIRTGESLGTNVKLSGRVTSLTQERNLNLEVKLERTEIATFLSQVPQVEAATGFVEGGVQIQGRADAPSAQGELRLSGGSFVFRGAPISLDEVEAVARVDNQEFRVVRAIARAGGGLLQFTARAPFKGFSLSEINAQLEARGVRLPIADGVEMVADASLGADWTLSGAGISQRPRLTGAVTIQNFLYTRPIGIAADLDTLARKGKRTDVTVYDPEDDLVDLSIRVSALRPLLFRNNLLEADVSLESSLLLSGTNQRLGLQGALRINPGGRIWLRTNEFDIRQGAIQFEDPLRITPRVDLQASTEYRRVSSSAGGAAGTTTVAGAGLSGGVSAAGGLWRILLHAYGDADNLKLDLTSDPNLAQEDILLLLTIGMTRAELDQLQASNLGSTAALEALSALSGADRAVKTVIPILDDFRLGSAYSTRTGRTEPTVTVGKRISDQLRANVVTGLSENRDMRSNIEWRISPEMSVLGNYDNLSDVASRGLGNFGADLRIRLEF